MKNDYILKFNVYFWLITSIFSLERFTREDHLTPYKFRHGSRLTYREIKECQPVEHGAVPHEEFLIDKTSFSEELVVETKRFYRQFNRSNQNDFVYGHYSIVYDPLHTLSVLEPSHEGGCSHNVRETVANTALKNKCLVAVNAGYFNTLTGACLGNVVSDGRKVQHTGIQNAHFGIKRNGTIFVGYISDEEINKSNEFLQLVSGIGWIIRNNKSFINVSKGLECEKTEETGSIDYFFNVLSARTVIGHDDKGRIIIVQIDGKTGLHGINLPEMTEFLRELKVVNAINLDGGGSSTFVLNGTVVNFPSDICPDNFSLCSREVSTIVCIHEPYCDPTDCNNNGKCIKGKCYCNGHWQPPKCDYLFCEQNCSHQGNCTENGCKCYSGWMGESCNEKCPERRFGENCQQHCMCFNNSTCNPINGNCICKPGFRGKFCEQECPYTFYGQDCSEQCFCEESCDCDKITGKCRSIWNSSLSQNQCIIKNILRNQKLIENNQNQRYLIIIIGSLAAFTIISLLANIVLLWCSCTCSCQSIVPLCNRKRSNKKNRLYRIAADISSEDEELPMTVHSSRTNLN
ncbi:N-acetylglucosamine-1-phosphodiester alpha-N-acetylglucosaminidase-like isoform X1 [Centruroides sculpturatus]|uniref:N-acetylglucosamine-1-phosphodiester alpha-N-acetylglucosaminidase-like isoform X1 n=1 Tax=Centruroides sculpturatus TaxID=218467 RepID=UPI000C6DD3ED|nr:N-acetylglucosamine-1-phosphodiester alpha-N-acetylglucosaminidase-like isoform X1 [Centruroides sculpturatus]